MDEEVEEVDVATKAFMDEDEQFHLRWPWEQQPRPLSLGISEVDFGDGFTNLVEIGSPTPLSLSPKPTPMTATMDERATELQILEFGGLVGDSEEVGCNFLVSWATMVILVH